MTQINRKNNSCIYCEENPIVSNFHFCGVKCLDMDWATELNKLNQSSEAPIGSQIGSGSKINSNKPHQKIIDFSHDEKLDPFKIKLCPNFGSEIKCEAFPRKDDYGDYCNYCIKHHLDIPKPVSSEKSVSVYIYCTSTKRFMFHRRTFWLGTGRNKIATVSGGIEKGEQPDRATMRELLEETYLVPIGYPLREIHRTKNHVIYLLEISVEVHPVPRSKELYVGWGFQWLTRSEALEKEDLWDYNRDVLTNFLKDY